jgi:hypothetical protein
MPPCGLEPSIDRYRGNDPIYVRIGRIRPLGHHGPLSLKHIQIEIYAKGQHNKQKRMKAQNFGLKQNRKTRQGKKQTN